MSAWYALPMEMVRTSLRLKKHLKKTAERAALEHNITLQELFNEALKMYLGFINQKKEKEIVFYDKPIDKNLDNLTRDNIYTN